MLNNLSASINEKSATIAVIGLGYVGLPVACMFAREGFRTIGVDVKTKRIAKISSGENPILGIEPGLTELISDVVDNGQLICTTSYELLKKADIILISVQTPIEASTHRPKYHNLISALKNLAKVMSQGVLVIIESTIAPGTMDELVIPLLEKLTGGNCGEDFSVGHCPERVMPGRLLHNITYMNRVVGGFTEQTAEVMILLYRNIVKGELDMSNLLTAELVKTTENAYRDVQIGFANEIALICEQLGGDVWQVRNLVNKSPGRNVHYPGSGVGGHCIPKDSWLLIANVRDRIDPLIIPAAREINRYMPIHMLELLENAFTTNNLNLGNSTVAVLGYAYLQNSDDTRDSPSKVLVDRLVNKGTDVRIHDPYVGKYQRDLISVFYGADAVVIMVAHDDYINADWYSLLNYLRTPIIIDGRHVLPDNFRVDGAHIRVLGRGFLTEQ